MDAVLAELKRRSGQVLHKCFRKQHNFVYVFIVRHECLEPSKEPWRKDISAKDAYTRVLLRLRSFGFVVRDTSLLQVT